MSTPVVPPLFFDPAPPERDDGDPFAAENIILSTVETFAPIEDTEQPDAPLPLLPSLATDPHPPDAPGFDRLEAARQKHFYLQRELERAAKPLKKELGVSFETLSRYGYSEPTTDPGSARLAPILRKLTRNI
jgi:hypothetical protein